MKRSKIGTLYLDNYLNNKNLITFFLLIAILILNYIEMIKS